MAKKRKKDKKTEDEEYEFTPPEFKEREFLQKELKDTRAAIVTVGIAVLFGVLAAVVTATSPGLSAIAFLIGIAGIFLLKYIYGMLKVDISGFTKKNWAGTIVTYFFTFLAIWVLLINTPFADLADPSIDDVVIWVDEGTSFKALEYDEKANAWNLLKSSDALSINDTSTVNITATIADTGGLALAEIRIGSSDYQLLTKAASGKFEYTVGGAQLSGAFLEFTIHVKDENGNERFFTPPQITIVH